MLKVPVTLWLWQHSRYSIHSDCHSCFGSKKKSAEHAAWRDTKDGKIFETRVLWFWSVSLSSSYGIVFDITVDDGATQNIQKRIIPFLLHLRELCSIRILGATGYNIPRDDMLINSKLQAKWVIRLCFLFTKLISCKHLQPSIGAKTWGLEFISGSYGTSRQLHHIHLNLPFNNKTVQVFDLWQIWRGKECNSESGRLYKIIKLHLQVHGKTKAMPGYSNHRP